MKALPADLQSAPVGHLGTRPGPQKLSLRVVTVGPFRCRGNQESGQASATGMEVAASWTIPPLSHSESTDRMMELGRAQGEGLKSASGKTASPE